MKTRLLVYALLPFTMLVKAQWEFINPNPPQATYKSVVHVTDKKYAATGGTAIMMTNNSGETWQPAVLEGTYYFNCVFFVDEETGYAGGYDGALLKTTDGGNTWTLQASGVTYSLYDILFINDSAGFAVGGGKTILGTTNGGNTWNELIPSGTRPILTLYSICFTTPDEGIIVGEKGILYVTTDGGKTWELSNLPYYGYVTGIASGNPYTTIAVGWYGSVFRKYTGPEESPLDENNNVVSTNFIDDNAWPFTIFPNPATTHFHIKSESEVTGLEIYTLTGSLVSKIQGSVYGAVSTSGIAKGMYILVIHKNNKSYSQKLIIK